MKTAATSASVPGPSITNDYTDRIIEFNLPDAERFARGEWKHVTKLEYVA